MYNEQSDMIQYVDTLKEEPNKWSICNVSETLKKLNELHEENRLLEIEDERWVKASEHDQEVIDRLRKENEQLKKDLIDHSALISMLEDYQALKIEETLWNLTGAKSEEEFNELYKPYLDKAKRS